MLLWFRPALAALFTALAFILPAGPAFAAIYETPPLFCDDTVIHDYLAPLERLPKLHTPTSSGGLGFGPKNVRIAFSGQLIVDEGLAGYTLTHRRRGSSVHLDWDTETVLARVDWRGRTTAIEDRARKHVAGLWKSHGGGVGFSIDRRPGAYRLTVTFSSHSGRRLGEIGSYFRVVEPTKKTQFRLNADSYRPEQTVFGRIENFGTAMIFFGAAYAIERLEGTEWITAPESPKAFILPLYGTGAGRTGGCSPFRIPITMPAGRYRMSKGFGYGVHRDRHLVSAEFDIVS
jgi:hypothetical protein